MKVHGDYHRDGYAHLEHVLAPEITRAFLGKLHRDLGGGPIDMRRMKQVNLVERPTADIYGMHYAPMLALLWGLTPTMEQLVGKRLLPTYDYFRLYREGDICRVHHDRPSCEHSLSLTLDYADDRIWPIEVGADAREPNAGVDEDFGKEAFSRIEMRAGDALLYNGVAHRHGRITRNPNRWSAHLFMHWVDADGPYADHAFDQQPVPEKIDFQFIA
ncbi:hypothetical protein [Sphingomicrobium arenosum]|uniref:hypothetical protein n=1 Tax=Sphingomicrobium arenosum TaxID=2233861 RepID=UPI00223F72F9|nr:hypothetical protein [Sphingomicrobium arenosum]